MEKFTDSGRLGLTGEQRAVETLRLSEARYRRLFETAQDGILILHADTGQVVDANPFLKELLGYSQEEFLGRKLWEIGPFKGEDASKSAFAELQVNDRLHYQGLSLETKDGRRVEVEFISNAYVADGTRFIQCNIRDMTERKRAEELVREQASMLDHAHDAIIVRDINTRQITFWNQGAERLYGWTSSEAVGQNLGELIFAERNAPDTVTGELLRAGEWRGEGRHVTKAAKELMVSSHSTLVRDASGMPKSALIINIDITEQKKLEQQFLRAQRMESLGTLAGGIAHDLNNVLLPIMMSIDLLKMTSSDERTGEILATIETSTRRGADMVQQILSFARGVEGRRAMIDPLEIIPDMQHLVQDTFPKNILFHAELPATLPMFLGDHTQVHQVLLNLCVNARDAMPDGGTLTVSADSLRMDEHAAAMHPDARPGTYVSIKVTDTGTGIPQEVVDKIFDPFFTTKELGKGTGLGLSTVLAIIKSHGGFLSVHSKPGQGTTFTVCFPVGVSPEDVMPEVPEAMHPRGHGELILIVDDEVAVLSITQQVLEAYGYEVLIAANGVDALSLYKLHQTSVAAVLTDMMMPLMDGAATIRALRQMKSTVKIIAASGLASDGSSARALGVKLFLPKPYTAQTVLMALSEVLNDDC